MPRLAFLVLAALPASGQLPDFYKSVDRLIWVVDDAARVATAWRNLGFPGIEEPSEYDFQLEYRGKPAAARVRLATGRIGGVVVHFIQPLEGDNAYADFLRRHGSGVFSLMHRPPSRQVFEEELRRLESLGVAVLQRGSIARDNEAIRYAFLDTQREGKYALGLITGPPGALEDPPGGGARQVSQFAFVVRALEPVSRYWQRLGWPEMPVTEPQIRDPLYRGKPGVFEMKLGWHRHGRVPYEWILETKGPSIYQEHLRRHGEGFHHLAFQVEDMDREVAAWRAKGIEAGMSGAWGEAGKPGSGRFTYLDTQALGGIDVELLWNFRP